MSQDVELILVRGLPGSGKSTFARKYYSHYAHFEADMFFEQKGRYVPALIGKAHEWCQHQTLKALQARQSVVVSNTATRRWELAPYLEIAAKTGAKVKVVKCVGKFCNIHNVPVRTLEDMRKRWEDVEGETVYNPHDEVG